MTYWEALEEFVRHPVDVLKTVGPSMINAPASYAQNNRDTALPYTGYVDYLKNLAGTVSTEQELRMRLEDYKNLAVAGSRAGPEAMQAAFKSLDKELSAIWDMNHNNEWFGSSSSGSAPAPEVSGGVGIMTVLVIVLVVLVVGFVAAKFL